MSSFLAHKLQEREQQNQKLVLPKTALEPRTIWHLTAKPQDRDPQILIEQPLLQLDDFVSRWLHSDYDVGRSATLHIKPVERPEEPIYGYSNCVVLFEESFQQSARLPYLQRIFDFTLLLINKCAQEEKPDEFLDKHLPQLIDDQNPLAPHNPLEIATPIASHPPGAKFTHARNRVDRRYTKRHFKKRGVVKMKIDLNQQNSE